MALAAGGLYVGAQVVTADQRSVFSSSEQTVQPGSSEVVTEAEAREGDRADE